MCSRLEPDIFCLDESLTSLVNRHGLDTDQSQRSLMIIREMD